MTTKAAPTDCNSGSSRILSRCAPVEKHGGCHNPVYGAIMLTNTTHETRSPTVIEGVSSGAIGDERQNPVLHTSVTGCGSLVLLLTELYDIPP